MKSIHQMLLTLSIFAVAIDTFADDAQEKEYVGCYTCCFESNQFNPIPNPHHEFWQVVSVPANFSELSKNIPSHGINYEYYLKVKAKLGPNGHFGHMGLSTHKMEIAQVLELREYKKTDGVCGIPPPEMVQAPK